MKLPKGESQRKLEKFKKKISDEAERKRRENALDEAIENTFPASDPVSAEQPMKALDLETPPTARAALKITSSQSHRPPCCPLDRLE